MIFALLTLAMNLQQPRVPLHFEPNQGQVAGETEWIAKAPGGTLFIKSTAIAFATSDPGKKPRIMRFVGAKPVKGEGLEPSGGYSNYFTGRDERNWHSGIPHYAKVRYKGLYKGIDLVYYATPDRQIEYDLEVQPGADLTQVELSFTGFDKIEIDEQGDLNLHQGNHSIKQHRPKVLQAGNEIPCSYRSLPGNRIKIEVAPHDEALPITVDPVLDFSTYVGGPGNDYFGAVALDQSGNIYAAGNTETPASPSLNPFQQTNTVLGTPFVLKLTPNADRILFFSVLRSSGIGTASGIGVDATGSPTLIGTTSAIDFPLKNAFQTTITTALYAGFVARLTADGTKIVYSSYYGGSGVDTLFQGLLDTNGDFVFSGNTSSHDLPVKNAFQPAYGGGTADCFLAKVDPTGALVYSTYFGGSGQDYCYGGLAFDNAGRIYIDGTTWSDDLPLKNPIQTILTPRNGYPSAFVARLSADGSSLDYGTFLGGVGSGELVAVAINSKGEIYVGGSAYGNQFSTVNAFQSTCVSDRCGLLMKLDPTGQQIMASTFFAGSGRSLVRLVAIGSDDSIYVAGSADSSDFPTLNNLFPFAGGGPDSQDIFVARFSPDVRTLLYSTFIGGDGEDTVAGLAIDSANRLYLSGGTGSDNFPVKNAYQPAYEGGYDAFLLRLSDSTAPFVPPLIATPGQVRLRYVQGGSPLISQQIQLTGAVPFTISADAAWVTVNPQSGTAPATLTIGAAQLVPGNYTATVTATPTSGGAPLSIPVSYTVLSPAPNLTSVSPSFVPLLSDDTIVTFTGSGFTPQTQLVLNNNIWGPPVGGSSVIFVDAQTLKTRMSYLWFITPGSYSFSAVNPQSDTSGAVTVSVGGTTPVITSIVNDASQLTGPLAPGELIQINGANFGPAGQLAVTIGGIGATVISSSNTQAQVVVPSQLQGTSVEVVLSSGGLTSITSTLPLAPAVPGLFTADMSGKGPALIQGTAAPGSTITLFGTGGGNLSLPFTATINGADAPVKSVAFVPSQPGWFQVTVTIPSDFPTLVRGHGPARPSPPNVVVSVGGQPSQAGVTLALQVIQ